MDIHIFSIPYDSGQKAARMGRGPEHFLQNGLAGHLEGLGHSVQVEQIDAPDVDGFRAEVKTSFDLYRVLAERVRRASSLGHFPLILSGNCGSALGALAGLSSGQRQLGLVWFDAHGDFNTPETTRSGFLDGMGLAAAAGLCWKEMTASLPGFRPLPAERIVHLGGRDFDPQERERMEAAGLALVSAQRIHEAGPDAGLQPALDALQIRANSLYIHLDLDVMDPQLAPANQFPAPGGLDPQQVLEALALIRQRFPLSAAGLASYDPAYDPEGRTLQAGFRLIEALL